ncbi:uncharacterized protein EDB91DRAFT_1285557 [Suillus paluster]|uniref:uncharacterized protein n=1 Tax=Suillus paluster TaxID=48578 RepID=UPI001B886FB3|nr:uncharacterized protein EDB91DRAFT_1285557 [Suillus paluster]KAG1719646.1 hypothetical protein EDB91DRAFT_1285557 [Suillus paluster]
MSVIQEGPGRLGTFAALARISPTISEIVLQLLWKQMHSVEPLLRLVGGKRKEKSDGLWLWSLDSSHLGRFAIYARRVRAICADGKALKSQHKRAFTILLQSCVRIKSPVPLLPLLNHVELHNQNDCLAQFLGGLFCPALQTLILPPHMSKFPQIQNMMSHLQTLVFIACPTQTRSILNSLSDHKSMRHLTLSYINPTAMAPLASLHKLVSLTFVITTQSSFIKEATSFPKNSIHTNILHIQVELDDNSPMPTTTGFSAVMLLLSSHSIRSQGLSIKIPWYHPAKDTMHFFNCLASLASDNPNHRFLAWENLECFRLQMEWNEDQMNMGYDVLQMPCDGLSVLYQLFFLTTLELEDLVRLG